MIDNFVAIVIGRPLARHLRQVEFANFGIRLDRIMASWDLCAGMQRDTRLCETRVPESNIEPANSHIYFSHNKHDTDRMGEYNEYEDHQGKWWYRFVAFDPRTGKESAFKVEPPKVNPVCKDPFHYVFSNVLANEMLSYGLN